jgi:hypothetical protein
LDKRRGFILLATLLLLPAAARAANITITGEDVLTQYTAADGRLTFLDTNSAGGGEPGLITAETTGLLPSSADVFFDAVLSPYRFNGTTAYNPATDSALQGNFVGRNQGASEMPTILITDGAALPTTLLIFKALVYENDLAGSGPRGGIKVSGATVTASSPDNPDGDLVIGSLDTSCPGDKDGLCKNEVMLTGGALAAQFGGVGSIGYLHMRMNSPNPDLTDTSILGYFGSDFTSGNGLLNAPTNWELTIVPVPEPGTFSLLLVSMLGLSAARRRRTRVR